jgi:hypothetical protein
MAESAKTLADIPSTGSSDALVETRGGPTVSHDALAANADEIAAIVRKYEALNCNRFAYACLGRQLHTYGCN